MPMDGPPSAKLLATVEEILEIPDRQALAPYRRLLHLADDEIARRLDHPSSKGAWLWHVLVTPLRTSVPLKLGRDTPGVVRLSPPVEVMLAPQPGVGTRTPSHSPAAPPVTA